MTDSKTYFCACKSFMLDLSLHLGYADQRTNQYMENTAHALGSWHRKASNENQSCSNVGKLCHTLRFCPASFKPASLQWNLNLTKRQGTREIGSLYRGSVPYCTFQKAGLENIVCFTENLVV